MMQLCNLRSGPNGQCGPNGAYAVLSKETPLFPDGFDTIDEALGRLTTWVCDPWDYDEEAGAYVAQWVGNEWVPVFRDGRLLDDDYIRETPLNGVPSIVDWFDPYNAEHLRAFRSVRNGGSWPEGVLPASLVVGKPFYMTYWPKDWQDQLKSKIADIWTDFHEYMAEE